MKKGLFISLLVFASQLFAHQYNDGTTFVVADALIWKLREGAAEDWGQYISPAGTYRTADILDVPFKLQAGLRLGVGHKINYDGWDTAFYYTWFQAKRSTQANVTSGALYSAYLGNFFLNNLNGSGVSGPVYLNANIQWKFFFNTFDLELGRTFKIDEVLKIRPFIGLKAGIINQYIYTNWQNPTPATNFTSASENLKNNYAGIGPAIGVDTQWSFYETHKHNFNIFGNISGALLAGHWTFRDQCINNAGVSVTIHSKPINGASSMLRGLLGLGWTAYYAHSHLTVRLGYEAQVWFNQLQYYSYNGGRLNGLMSLQGGVLGFYYYF